MRKILNRIANSLEILALAQVRRCINLDHEDATELNATLVEGMVERAEKLVKKSGA